MRITWLVPFAALLASSVLSSETEKEMPLLPFASPENAGSTDSQRAFEVLRLLKKRQDNCQSGYHACSNMGNSNVCCQASSSCTKDSSNNIACCPTGASCTGTLAGGGGTPGAAQTSSSFQFPSSVGATGTPALSSDPQVTGTTLAGAAYPFVVVPTTFSNAGMCSAYYSACQTDYVRCTSALGSNYQVTVGGGGGGGGVTVGGTPAASVVASTCSSMSMAACHGLQLANCPTYGGQTGGAGRGASGGRIPSAKDLMFALVIGVTGMFI